ncbi:hypothetical protein BJ508DRAFT_325690 [Ascobolus immersus RN42]|uniref:Uncharacterized protein n=1 Tax=Ascobolus immersus RN42 TaxID=1160509 RepID=A0A3N4I7W1_ASCIM|nr:hypothetical protein BJ508DRAFT_325690 [Ascobolus immersus RN42]
MSRFPQPPQPPTPTPTSTANHLITTFYGTRLNFQHSHGLTMTPSDLEEGNLILAAIQEELRSQSLDAQRREEQERQRRLMAAHRRAMAEKAAREDGYESADSLKEECIRRMLHTRDWREREDQRQEEMRRRFEEEERGRKVEEMRRGVEEMRRQISQMKLVERAGLGKGRTVFDEVIEEEEEEGSS